MNIGGAIVIYVLIWWLVFFMLLPSGVQSRWESDDDGVEGADPGAPRNPDLKRKAIKASVIAAVLSVFAMLVIMSGVINFKE